MCKTPLLQCLTKLSIGVRACVRTYLQGKLSKLALLACLAVSRKIIAPPVALISNPQIHPSVNTNSCLENLQFHSLPFFSIGHFFPWHHHHHSATQKCTTEQRNRKLRETCCALCALCVSVPGEDEICESRSVRSLSNLCEKIVLVGDRDRSLGDRSNAPQ